MKGRGGAGICVLYGINNCCLKKFSKILKILETNNISYDFLWLFKNKLVTLQCKLLSFTFNYAVIMEISQNVKNCIYRLVFPDGKYYVGKTKDLRDRVRLYECKMNDSNDSSRVMIALRDFGIGMLGLKF